MINRQPQGLRVLPGDVLAIPRRRQFPQTRIQLKRHHVGQTESAFFKGG